MIFDLGNMTELRGMYNYNWAMLIIKDLHCVLSQRMRSPFAVSLCL